MGQRRRAREYALQLLFQIDLSGGPPEVSFDFVSASEGMELIERSRGASSRAGRNPNEEGDEP